MHYIQIWLVVRSRMTKCVFYVLCNFVFFYHEYEKKNCQPLCIFVLFNTLVQMCKKTILRTCFVGFIFFVFFGFCCKRVVRPKQHRGNPLCILRVFVFFFSYKRTNAQGNPLCILRVFVFFFSIKKQMNRSCVLCVFVFFLQISGHKTNVLHVFLCFFVYKLLLQS